MGQVLSFLENPAQHSSPELQSHSQQAKSIQAVSRSALLVEGSEDLRKVIRIWLEREGYAVRLASTAKEGFRLFQDFSPFNVVIIDYFVPQNEDDMIDPLAAFQIHAVELATAIHNDTSTQDVVIMARDYRSAAEVPLPSEAGYVRLLTGNDQLHDLLERIEVDRAIKSLTTADRIRLKSYADYKIRGLGRAVTDRDGRDLLAEAVYRTLLGTRHWRKDVDFVHHLRESMRSIAFQWKRELKQSPFADNTSTDQQGEEHSILEVATIESMTAERSLIAEIELFEVFQGDREATSILRGAADGLKESDIKSKYDLDERQYAAALRRIRQILRVRGKRGR
jgi:CheY-like chemotaxis protein